MTDRFDDFDDDGEIPGASDMARSARDVDDPDRDRLATDSLDDLRDRELGSPDGAYADDEPIDPAMAPVIEAGGGVAEGFEQAEHDLVEHATDPYGSTRDILFDAIEEEEHEVDDLYGEADDARSSAGEDDY